MSFLRRRRKTEAGGSPAPEAPAREEIAASAAAKVADIVRKLGSLTGISMIMLVGKNGEDIYRWYRTTADTLSIRMSSRDVSSLAAHASFLMSGASRTGLDDVIVRTGDKVAVLHTAGPVYLLVLADRAANLALLLVRSKAAARQIAEVMGVR